MSDLQCAATFLLVCPAEDQVSGLAGALRGRNVAVVYTDPATAAVQTAQTLAAELGLPLRTGAGELTAELAAAADLHRGETVVHVAPGDTIAVAVSRLAGNLPAVRRGSVPPAPGDVVEVAADADGWVVRPSGDTESGRPVANRRFGPSR